jgi:hypothetical protein
LRMVHRTKAAVQPRRLGGADPIQTIDNPIARS